ncbi:MAG: 16S rRNA (cytidine(1402)-2'-O)-methyltransferase [Bacteroidota bacterium]
MNKPSLYIVPTPIGNLEDMTHRAIRILKEVDLVLAEDTRTSKKLFNHYGIETKMSAFHQHNEHRIVGSIIDKLKTGLHMALVSDAGTPGISDPGFLLVRACLQNGIEVSTLPGPTAFVPALINSGFPCDRFIFEGFLPHKKGRKTKMESIALEKRTVILYESPHRIIKCIEQLSEHIGERRVCLSRELSKVYEENLIGTCAELLLKFEKIRPKGEMVVIIQGMQ